ncbi:MAG TPA: hypothetical protein VGC79_10250 [Polyangiaceae bacterium]
MQRSVVGRAGLAAALAIWGQAAAAEPSAAPALAPPTLQIASLAAQSCVSEPEVRAALLQAGLKFASDSAAQGPGSTRIEVAGTPEHLSVQLQTADHADSTLMPPATCATATDVVVAFLVSTLAPAPSSPIPTPTLVVPSLDTATLSEAVRAELARRGIQLALERVRLSVERDGSGTWFARVSGADQPNVAHTIALGNFDEPSAPRIDTVTDVVARVVREVSALQRAQAAVSPAQAALNHALDRVERDSSTTTWLGVAEIALGSSMLLLLLGDSPNDHATDAMLAVGGSVAVFGGSASFLISADYRRTVVGASSLAAFGALATAFTVSRERTVPAYSTAALAAGSYSSAALLGLNVILRRPPLARLRAARRMLHERAASEDDVRQIDADLAQSVPALPAWLSYSPLIAGGLVATLPAFADGFATDLRNGVAAGGAISCAIGLAGVLLPSNYARYQDELRQSGVTDLAFGVLPGARYGISLSGRF